MKVPLGWLVSWALYGLGHGVSKIMDGPQACVLYPIYNWLMHASDDVQQWAGCDGPWVEDEE